MKKEKYSPQLGGVKDSHHNMVSPQMLTPGAGRPPSSDATGTTGYGTKPIFKTNHAQFQMVNKKIIAFTPLTLGEKQ